jgi:hypothetical protein
MKKDLNFEFSILKKTFSEIFCKLNVNQSWRVLQVFCDVLFFSLNLIEFL